MMIEEQNLPLGDGTKVILQNLGRMNPHSSQPSQLFSSSPGDSMETPPKIPKEDCDAPATTNRMGLQLPDGTFKYLG